LAKILKDLGLKLEDLRKALVSTVLKLNLRAGLTEQRRLRQMARTFRYIKIEGKDAFVLFDTGSLYD
jgi:hypothetical protein